LILLKPEKKQNLKEETNSVFNDCVQKPEQVRIKDLFPIFIRYTQEDSKAF